jgi:hypothetical protein
MRSFTIQTTELKFLEETEVTIMILCVISMFIYVCECIGLCNIVIMMHMYMYLTMLYPINDLNLNYLKIPPTVYLQMHSKTDLILGK